MLAILSTVWKLCIFFQKKIFLEIYKYYLVSKILAIAVASVHTEQSNQGISTDEW